MMTHSIAQDTRSPGPAIAPRRGDGANATGDGVAMLAFDALLDSARAAAPASAAREATGTTTASQMFEAAGGEAHERRQAALKNDYNSSATGSKYSASAATDVESRLAARAAAMPQRSDGLALASKEIASIESRTDAGRHAPSAADMAELSRFDRGDAPTNTARSASASSPDSKVDAAGPLVRANPAAQPAFAVKQIGTSNSSNGQSPAQRVASLLASARGATETTRAPSPSAVATDARQSSGDRKTAGRSSSESTTSRRSDQAPMRLAEGGRSAFDQLVRSIRLQAGARRSSARIQLDPPEMGRVRVDLRIEGEKLSIEVRAENKHARDLLSERAERLTTALQHRGLTVERFDVTIDPVDERSHEKSGEANFAAHDPATHGERRREEEAASQTRSFNTELLESATADATDIAEAEALAAQAGEPDERLDIRI